MQILNGGGAQPHCQKGYHWEESYNRLNGYYNQGLCVPNSSSCKKYDLKSGNCEECSWGYDIVTDKDQGHHCLAKWYMTLIIVLSILVGIILIIIIVWCVGRCCAKRNSMVMVDYD